MGSDASFFSLVGCKAGSILKSGTGGMVIFGEKKFYCGSVVTLEATVKIASKAELYFSTKYEQSNWSHYLLNFYRKI